MDKITFPPLSSLKLIYSNAAVTREKRAEQKDAFEKKKKKKAVFIAEAKQIKHSLRKGNIRKRESNPTREKKFCCSKYIWIFQSFIG
ncbi:hypothetical protein CEXT_618841 [Caerostris extrusa]|uniref:Uncharacterized protein n=1 Tax=Caerostris extrusa TaxID=172846 RepID=A0AAV4X450_CAEEX|nr:hypothetical protein CEXT_618841 [Caerostris extrusa]